MLSKKPVKSLTIGAGSLSGSRHVSCTTVKNLLYVRRLEQIETMPLRFHEAQFQ
jgi:hypothetical protein